jgi:hypothetical protein
LETQPAQFLVLADSRDVRIALQQLGDVIGEWVQQETAEELDWPVKSHTLSGGLLASAKFFHHLCYHSVRWSTTKYTLHPMKWKPTLSDCRQTPIWK